MQHSKNIIKRFGFGRCPAPASTSLPAKHSALNIELVGSARLSACCRKLYTLLLCSGRKQAENVHQVLGIRHRQRNMTWLKATTNMRNSSSDSDIRPKTLFDYLSAPLKSCLELSPFSIRQKLKESVVEQKNPKYGREFICSECSELSADIIKQETATTTTDLVIQPSVQIEEKNYDVIEAAALTPYSKADEYTQHSDTVEQETAATTIGFVSQPSVQFQQQHDIHVIEAIVPSPDSKTDEHCEFFKANDPSTGVDSTSTDEPQLPMDQWTDLESHYIESSQPAASTEQQITAVNKLNSGPSEKCRVQHLRINATTTGSKRKDIYKI